MGNGCERWVKINNLFGVLDFLIRFRREDYIILEVVIFGRISYIGIDIRFVIIMEC